MTQSVSAAPDVVAVSIISEPVVQLTFSNGIIRSVNLDTLMTGPIFDDVRSKRIFDAVYVDDDLGTIAWPNGADLPPERLYELACTEPTSEERWSRFSASLQAAYETAMRKLGNTDGVVLGATIEVAVHGYTGATGEIKVEPRGNNIDLTYWSTRYRNRAA